jgi:hypothetical protein
MRRQVCGESFHRCEHIRQWSSPHTATSPGKEIRARSGERPNIHIRQARIDGSPARAIVDGEILLKNEVSLFAVICAVPHYLNSSS